MTNAIGSEGTTGNTPQQSGVSSAIKWAGGIVSGVAVSVVVATCGIGAPKPTGVVIEGPSTVQYGTYFTLGGHVNGEYEWAYWTDTFGQQVPLPGYEQLEFTCPGVGEFRVLLTSVDAEGTRNIARHDVTCW